MKNSLNPVLQVCILETEEAQRWFKKMPAALQIPSLSPRFAAADVSRNHRLRVFHCGIEEGNQLWLINVHTLPFSLGDATGLISPYGYGGPLTLNATPPFNRQAFAAWDAFCKEQGWIAEFIRCHPMADVSAQALGESAVENRKTVAVDLSLAHVMAQYNNSAKSKVRHCMKAGVAAYWSRDPADWLAYGAFYRAAMQELKADSQYAFSDAYFEKLSSLPEAWLCLCTQAEKHDAGNANAWLSASVYLFGPEVVEYHLSSSNDGGRRLGTAALAQHAAALRGKEAGAKWLYLGGGTTPDPENPLYFFKRCFSKITKPFYVAQLIHAPERYSALQTEAGFNHAHRPPRLIF